ncbi:hypothetical protein C1645_739508 [Glomus cerebriforme]|uniref:Uncharacterized protein n=1 Tax=Glomus cerebriforme TaxID=658196 RepID=A0A397SRG7_9GLOM|nr:hypothetical protein C1645_739508 [Glomus cerebriforme]
MSQSQFPKSLFSHFTEDELKKISESYKSSVNWTKYNKWLKEGQPFEEHEEIELFTNGSSQRQVSAESENKQLESDPTIVMERPIIRPGRKAILQLPLQNPKPKLSLVMTVNIVVKFLDPTRFPVLSRYTTQMLEDLNDAGLLNDVVGLYFKGRIREFRNGEIHLKPNVDIYDIVPKGSYMYTLVLPRGQYLMLRHHHHEEWFR